MFDSLFKPTRSYEIDQNLLKMITHLYDAFQAHPEKTILDIASLSGLAKQFGLSQTPSQNVLMNVDWKQKPTIETAIMIHRSMNDEKRKVTKPVATKSEPAQEPEAPGLKVVGKIDLDSINEKTRPDKKNRDQRDAYMEEVRKHPDNLVYSEPLPGVTPAEIDGDEVQKLKIQIQILQGSLSSVERERNLFKRELAKIKERDIIPGETVVADPELEKQLEEAQDELSKVMIERNELRDRNTVLQQDLAKLNEYMEMLKDETQHFFQRYCTIVEGVENVEAETEAAPEA